MNKVHKITKAIAIIMAALTLGSTMMPAMATSKTDPKYRIATAAEYYEYSKLVHEATPWGFASTLVDNGSVTSDAQNITLNFPNETALRLANLLYGKDINYTTLTYADTLKHQAVHPTDAIFQQLGVTDSSQKMSLLDAFASTPYTAPEIYLSKSDFTGLDFYKLIEDSKDNIGYYILDRFEFSANLYNFYDLDRLIGSHTTVRAGGGGYLNNCQLVIERKAEFLKKVDELYAGISDDLGKIVFALSAAERVEGSCLREIDFREKVYDTGSFGIGITKEQGDQAEADVLAARGSNTVYVMKHLGYDAKLIENGSMIQFLFRGTMHKIPAAKIFENLVSLNNKTSYSEEEIEAIHKAFDSLNKLSELDTDEITTNDVYARMDAKIDQLAQLAIDYKEKASYGILPLEVSNSGFLDITKGSELDTALTKLVGAGIISGVGNAKYAPNGSLTREQASKIIVTLLKLQNETPAVSNFPDVTSDNWSQSSIAIAFKHGLMKGLPNGNFGRTDLLTAGQLLTMMNRALKENDKVTATGLPWPAGDIANAKADGLIDGINVSDGSQGISRGETALIVYRTLNLLIQKGIVPAS